MMKLSARWSYYSGTGALAQSPLQGYGFQGELTTRYEIARRTALRIFVQADATLPFFNAASNSNSTANVVTTSRSYVPSLVFSLGFGWQRDRR